MTLTARLSDVPAAVAISPMLRKAWSTCSPIDPISPVSRLRPAWPDVYSSEPTRTAWTNGPVGAGAPSAGDPLKLAH